MIGTHDWENYYMSHDFFHSGMTVNLFHCSNNMKIKRNVLLS